MSPTSDPPPPDASRIFRYDCTPTFTVIVPVASPIKELELIIIEPDEKANSGSNEKINIF